MRVSVTASLLVLLPALAWAEPAISTFGGRVGGYGFRDAGRWDDCRMDGVGLFADRSFGQHAFVEVGLDMYHATGDTVMLEGMDRLSTQVSVAGGLRMFPSSIVSPYIQVGVGAEVTHVHMAEAGHAGDHVLPLGFVGVGGDLKIGQHLQLGANVRFHMMAHFDHEHAVVGAEEEDHEMDISTGAAAQVQFFAKYRL
jgi:hypothetical protein